MDWHTQSSLLMKANSFQQTFDQPKPRLPISLLPEKCCEDSVAVKHPFSPAKQKVVKQVFHQGFFFQKIEAFKQPVFFFNTFCRENAAHPVIKRYFKPNT